MTDIKRARPFLKWAGNKKDVAPRIAHLLPADLRERRYTEPFLGAGGMYLWLASEGLVDPARCSLSDGEAPLVACHRAVRDRPEELMVELDHLSAQALTWEGGDEAHFAAARSWHNDRRYYVHEAGFTEAQRAAWLVYLNKTCFNGLYRTNGRGEFNSPWGKRTAVTLYERDNLLACSAALRGARLECLDFEDALLEACEPGDVAYLDPPYVPASETARFTGYGGGWRDADHERLGAVFRELDRRGCLLVLSNSDTVRTRAIFDGYDLAEIDVRRSVGASAGSRVKARELVVRNLAAWPGSARGGV